MSSGNYDPHLHREVSNGLSNGVALVHILKGAIGTGILAMPDAFKNSGYICGTLGTVLLACLITNCTHSLMKSQYAICKKHHTPFMSYAESMKMALHMGPSCLSSCSNCSAHIVNWFLIIAQTGACCAYVTFVAENLRKVLQAHTDVNMDLRIYMIILIVPFILLNLVKNLKYLAPFSMLADLLTLIGIIVVLYYLFKDGLSFDDRAAASSVSRWPLFLGTVLFSLQAIGVVLPVEYKMKKPKDFGGPSGIMNISMFIITVLYITVGFTGYIKYGENVLGSITLNLPEKEFLANSITIFYILAISVSHTLQSYLPIQILLDDYIKKHLSEEFKNFEIVEYVTHITYVLLTVLLAIAIPKLSFIISFFGAFCLSMLGITFPAIMEICIHYQDFDGRNYWNLILNIFLIIFGIMGFIAGSYVAINDVLNG
ncbi:proton-coupled amino acid transporter-like protein CG1139 [Sergentomyia squamirostris]